MKFLRKILVKILGFPAYLRLVSSSYLFLVRLGFFKKRYAELFFLKQIVKEGDHCIDIGANVGYYSLILSRQCKEKGRVWAVEPVRVFAQVLAKNVRASRFYDNVELMPFALGRQEGKIRMGTPVVDGVIRHGLTKVIDGTEENMAQVYDVEMKVPDRMFEQIERLDFVKIDVEGYETIVIPNFLKVLGKFQPLVQIELSTPENKKQIYKHLAAIGYKPFVLENKSLLALSDDDFISSAHGDYYFSCK